MSSLAEVIPISGWDTFYMIMGSASGALTGLMFVVMSLRRDIRIPTTTSNPARSFSTPTIVHFTVVLSLSAILSMPRHSRASLGIVVLLVGVGGLAYMTFVISNMRKIEIYTPDLEDKVWHFGLPPVAYLLVLAGGFWAWASPTTTLNLVGIAMVALLVCGIHNAWDSAIWMISYLARDHDPTSGDS